MFQEQALSILKSGKNVFLTGSAGTGKTFLLNQFIQYLKKYQVPVAITASTGIASTHMNGTTIHSWSGIGIKNEITLQDLSRLKDKKYLLKNIQSTHILIIDEISMLHKKQLDMINKVLKHIRNSPLAFGGMQVVFAGDFFQLPPISREAEEAREKFAFMSEAWQEAAPVICYLTEQYRQSNNDLNQILNQMRAQEMEVSMYELLSATKFNQLSISPTRLYTHNINVDEENELELKKIDAESRVFFAKLKGNEKMLEGFVKSLLVGERLELKIGAKVMFVKNNHEKGYMNGSLGEVVDFVFDESELDYFPEIKMSDGTKIIATPEVWTIDNEKGKPLVQFIQVPLRLAWAITVHKSQGMTLDAAEMDLSRCFEAGQGYVALSRLKNLEGLKLLGINQHAFVVDELAAKADRRFKQLSKEAEMFDTKNLESEAQKHILKSGGTLDEQKIKKALQTKKQKEDKKSTYEITIEMIQKGMSIKAMAEERGLTPGTIIGHLLIISNKYPDVNIDHFRPDTSVMKVVTLAYLDLLKENKNDKNFRPSSGQLFSKLNAKYGYEDIKLAMPFVQKALKL